MPSRLGRLDLCSHHATRNERERLPQSESEGKVTSCTRHVITVCCRVPRSSCKQASLSPLRAKIPNQGRKTTHPVRRLKHRHLEASRPSVRAFVTRISARLTIDCPIEQAFGVPVFCFRPTRPVRCRSFSVRPRRAVSRAVPRSGKREPCACLTLTVAGWPLLARSRQTP